MLRLCFFFFSSRHPSQVRLAKIISEKLFFELLLLFYLLQCGRREFFYPQSLERCFLELMCTVVQYIYIYSELCSCQFRTAFEALFVDLVAIDWILRTRLSSATLLFAMGAGPSLPFFSLRAIALVLLGCFPRLHYCDGESARTVRLYQVSEEQRGRQSERERQTERQTQRERKRERERQGEREWWEEREEKLRGANVSCCRFTSYCYTVAMSGVLMVLSDRVTYILSSFPLVRLAMCWFWCASFVSIFSSASLRGLHIGCKRKRERKDRDYSVLLLVFSLFSLVSLPVYSL